MLPLFLKISERRQVKNRVHLDLAAADLDSEVKRLVNPGGERRRDLRLARLALLDPQGNGFFLRDSSYISVNGRHGSLLVVLSPRTIRVPRRQLLTAPVTSGAALSQEGKRRPAKLLPT